MKKKFVLCKSFLPKLQIFSVTIFDIKNNNKTLSNGPTSARDCSCAERAALEYAGR